MSRRTVIGDICRGLTYLFPLKEVLKVGDSLLMGGRRLQELEEHRPQRLILLEVVKVPVKPRLQHAEDSAENWYERREQ